MTPPSITELARLDAWAKRLKAAGFVPSERPWPDAADAAPHDAVPPVLAAALPAALSLADAVLLTVDPQAIIQREWVRCDEPARMFRAIRALGLIALYYEAWDAYARAMRARRRAGAKPREWYGVGAIRRLSPTLLVPDAALAGACPVLAEVRS